MKRIRIYKRPLAVAAMVLGLSLVSVSGAGAVQMPGSGEATVDCTAPQQLQAHDGELCREPLSSLDAQYQATAGGSESTSAPVIDADWVVGGALTALMAIGMVSLINHRRHALS